jgi:cell division protein FtsN
LSYFVQAGAFGRVEDAEQQRAKLAMMGLQAKITEREQSGRTMFRVRIGPYDKKEDADLAKEKLDGVGVESALVRVQK